MGQSEGQDFAGRVATQAASVSVDRQVLITLLFYDIELCAAVFTLLKGFNTLSVEECAAPMVECFFPSSQFTIALAGSA